MRNSLTGLSKTILGVMIAIILVSGFVVFSLRSIEAGIKPIRDSEYVARDRANTSSPLVHGFWVFDSFDYSDYLTDSDSLQATTPPIIPGKDATPEQYRAARYYSCNIDDSSDDGSFYWVSFREIEDAALFKKYFSSLNSVFPFTLIRDRYNRFYNDKQYDKRNRKRFFKMFDLPDPDEYEPVMVLNTRKRFKDDVPGIGSIMDGLEVKYVDKDRLVLTYKDPKGILDLVYKNKSSLPRETLSYSVYFNNL